MVWIVNLRLMNKFTRCSHFCNCTNKQTEYIPPNNWVYLKTHNW